MGPGKRLFDVLRSPRLVRTAAPQAVKELFMGPETKMEPGRGVETIIPLCRRGLGSPISRVIVAAVPPRMS